MFNAVFLSGNVGNDIILSQTKDNTPACSFYIANEVKKGLDPVWIRINAYGELAKLCHEKVRKGHLIVVRGEIINRRYSDKSDDGYLATEVRCNEIIFQRGN